MKTTQEIVLEIKADAKKLHKLISAIAIVHPSNMMDMICVLLQNLAFNRSDCFGYDPDKELERMHNIKKALSAFKEYHDYHTISFIVDEIGMAFDVAHFDEDYIASYEPD
jgi:hypothetical protein